MTFRTAAGRLPLMATKFDVTVAIIIVSIGIMFDVTTIVSIGIAYSLM